MKSYTCKWPYWPGGPRSFTAQWDQHVANDIDLQLQQARHIIPETHGLDLVIELFASVKRIVNAQQASGWIQCLDFFEFFKKRTDFVEPFALIASAVLTESVSAALTTSFLFFKQIHESNGRYHSEISQVIYQMKFNWLASNINISRTNRQIKLAKGNANCNFGSFLQLISRFHYMNNTSEIKTDSSARSLLYILRSDWMKFEITVAWQGMNRYSIILSKIWGISDRLVSKYWSCSCGERWETQAWSSSHRRSFQNSQKK